MSASESLGTYDTWVGPSYARAAGKNSQRIQPVCAASLQSSRLHSTAVPSTDYKARVRRMRTQAEGTTRTHIIWTTDNIQDLHISEILNVNKRKF